MNQRKIRIIKGTLDKSDNIERRYNRFMKQLSENGFQSYVSSKHVYDEGKLAIVIEYEQRTAKQGAFLK